MEEYRLTVSFDEFKSVIEKQIKEGEELQNMKIESQADLLILIDWNIISSSSLKECFKDPSNKLIELYSHSGRSRLSRFELNEESVKKPSFETEVINERNFLKRRINALNEILQYGMISDIMTNPENVDLEKINRLSVEEKKLTILRKLKRISNGNYHNLKTILYLNGIKLKYKEEEDELAKSLKKSDHIDIQGYESSNIQIRITIEGLNYIEKKEKNISTSENKKIKEKNDYLNVCRKIDEVLKRLDKMELNSNIEHEVIFNEIEELKGLYLKLNKKNWKQILVGKLAELSMSKAVENDTIKFIYEGITGDELKLLY